MNSTKYHVLAEMSRDFLTIQVSNVASESTFSTGRRVLGAFRSSLSPAMVEALICCQNWIRSSSLPLDISSVLEEMKTYQVDSGNNYFCSLIISHCKIEYVMFFIDGSGTTEVVNLE